MNKNILIFLLLATSFIGFSQKKKDVLMTINNQNVTATEFEKVFNKNLDLVIDDSQKNVDGYLNLFIDYKIKVMEAYAQGLDKNETYIKEFEKYKDQLSKKYIYDKRVTSELVEEAYQRGLEQIDVDHILIMLISNTSPQDTLVAYNKIKSIRDKAISGTDFEKLARQYSEEPGVKKSGGKLGYFTVFQMVYNFETAAYNTKVGSVSDIVRTEFGYHIIKVNDRRKMEPKISVSHIMIFDNDKRKNDKAEEKINEIYAMLMQGESFEKLAKQFSEDKATGIKGGKLKIFGPGNLKAPLFEKAAYGLTKKGEISKPVKSSFGWHVIKLNEKFPIPAFAEIKEDIEKKVENGARARIVTQAINNKILKKYGYKEGASYLPYFNTFVTDSVLQKKWDYVKVPTSENKVLFTIGDRNVTFDDFAIFISNKQKLSKRYKVKERLFADYYIEFHDKEIVDYYKFKLEEENPEYASILNEYRNGLLIFDVMQKNIWDAAKLDTLGQKAYYERTKKEYNWKNRVDAAIVSATNPETAKQAQLLLKQESDIDKLKTQLNTDGKVNVIITKGVFEVGGHELPKDLDIKMGVSEIYKRDDSSVVVKINEILSPSPKSFEDVKGIVLSNYQNKVEQDWMDELHSKYKVVINKKVLKRVKKELDK